MSRPRGDYYSLLGIPRQASAGEIDRAYRRAARATHPDAHPDDTSAADRFKAVSIAYETLSNPARRASYDRAHPLVRSADPVELQGRRAGAPAVEPIHLGRRPPVSPEPLQPPGLSRRATSPLFDDDLLTFAAVLSRVIRSTWHLP